MTRFLLSVTAVALLATPAAAVTEILYSFEDGTAQGWTSSDHPGTHTAVLNGTGTTDGSYSLKVTGDQGNDQGGSFQRNSQVDLGASQLAALNAAAANGGSISFDLTIDLQEYHPDISFFKSQVVLNTDAGWSQRDLMEGNFLPPDTEDPAAVIPGPPFVQTFHFDLPLNSNVFSGSPPDGNATFAQIRIATNTWDDLFPPVGITERVIYLDNFAVNYVPEPASLTSAALLAGVGLAFRRRRG